MTFDARAIRTTLNVVALLFGLAGSWKASNAFMTEDEAIVIGDTVWSGDTREEKLQLPHVKALIAQARDGKTGLKLIFAAFACELVALAVPDRRRG